ncbi:MAG TPA: Dabb family protein [Tepidisphaeraceae bacterium]|jgi:hypothetical protein
MKSAAFPFALLSLIILSGCHHHHHHEQEAPPPPPPQQQQLQTQSQARVTHVVLCWLKEPGNETNRQKLIDASRAFAQIPGVVSVSAGRPIPSTRSVVDSSYDVAIVMKFRDQESLANYATSPIHLKARDTVLNPLVAKYLIYDFEE